MAPDLSDRDRDRFAAMRERLTNVERVDSTPSKNPPSRQAFDPMLATTFRGELHALDTTNWIAERKFDGTRIILQKFDGEVSLFTRRHIDRAETLPELAAEAEATLPDELILDGEFCYHTPDGVSRFLPIHHAGAAVERENLTSTYHVFDVLATDGTWRRREPLLARKERLADLLDGHTMLSPVDHRTGQFQAFFDDLIDCGEEGIVLKRMESPYHPGVRSDHWRKVKSFTEATVIAVGYTSGEGRRSDTFGALVLTDTDRYIGRVGSGFDTQTLERLHTEMTPIDAAPIPSATVGAAYTPIEPFAIRVKFQEINADGKLRAPVYLGEQRDMPIDAVEPLPDEV